MSTEHAGVLFVEDSPDNVKRIGELLVEEGHITGLQLAKALLHQRIYGGKIIDILVGQGALGKSEVANFLGRRPGIPSLNLGNYDVPRDLIALVPEEMAVKHEVFPVERMGQVLTLAMVCPLDRQAIQELAEVTGYKIRPILCSPEDIRAAISRYYRKREVFTLTLT